MSLFYFLKLQVIQSVLDSITGPQFPLQIEQMCFHLFMALGKISIEQAFQNLRKQDTSESQGSLSEILRNIFNFESGRVSVNLREYSCSEWNSNN